MPKEDRGRQARRSLTLYDAGGWFMFLVFLGIPAFFGSIIDYFWNYFVLRFTLERLRRNYGATAQNLAAQFTRGRLLLYALAATILGLIIDYIWADITWGYNFGLRIISAGPLLSEVTEKVFLQVLSIVAPMAAIALVNFLLARLYLRLPQKPAVIIGLVMGVLTAPWLILIAVLLANFT